MQTVLETEKPKPKATTLIEKKRRRASSANAGAGAIHGAVIAMFAIIIISSVKFTTPVWTLTITGTHLGLMFVIALMLLVAYYLRIKVSNARELAIARRKVAISAQAIARSKEAIDAALASLRTQTTTVKGQIAAGLLNTDKAHMGAFNQRLQEATEQLKRLQEASDQLRTANLKLEERRQQLVTLKGQMAKMTPK